MSSPDPAPASIPHALPETLYARGIAIVIAAILAALAIALALVGPKPKERAATDLASAGIAVGPFRLTERSGKAVTDADLAGRAWVASFIFTHCPLSCPRITSTLKGVQGKLAGTGVQIASISVDPERDTPEVLARYADRFDADPARWWFLTGDPAEIDRLVGQFKLTRAKAAPEEVAAGAEEFTHSDRLALVGPGNRLIGLYDSTDPAEVSKLIEAASRADGGWVYRLPFVNATLNGTCSVLLAIAWWLILAGKWRAHAACMVAALAVSAAFLACYLIYHFNVLSVPYKGEGMARYAYFTILLSHVALAIAMLPMIIMTVLRAARRRFAAHRRIASLTLPIWLYVSVTGVVVYWMLYQM
jgi:protein SCO1/2